LKSTIVKLFLFILVIGLTVTALYFVVPTSVKNTVTNYFVKSNTGLFTEEEVNITGTSLSEANDFYKKELDRLVKQEEVAFKQANDILHTYNLTEKEMESIKQTILNHYGKYDNIPDLEGTIKSYIVILKGTDFVN
jgi:hypothetical protein